MRNNNVTTKRLAAATRAVELEAEGQDRETIARMLADGGFRSTRGNRVYSLAGVGGLLTTARQLGLSKTGVAVKGQWVDNNGVPADDSEAAARERYAKQVCDTVEYALMADGSYTDKLTQIRRLTREEA